MARDTRADAAFGSVKREAAVSGAKLAREGGELSARLDMGRRIAPVLPGITIAHGSAGVGSAVDSAAPVRHCWRLARRPSSRRCQAPRRGPRR